MDKNRAMDVVHSDCLFVGNYISLFAQVEPLRAVQANGKANKTYYYTPGDHGMATRLVCALSCERVNEWLIRICFHSQNQKYF